ncbi:MAG: hypothetical protein ACREJC_09265 [Tepidisphaeraceae bacterium]
MTAGWMWVGRAFVALCFAFMLWWTWLDWPDPVLDFGRELYVPWRLSEGQVLYRDINYFNGPFSVYLHSLLFRMFGVSLRTLVWFNIAVTFATTFFVMHLVRRISDDLSSIAAGFCFVTLFACAQLSLVGNDNYICSYSYDLPHGIALSLATLACVDQYIRSRRLTWSAASGLLLGLTFLTKAEVFLAACVAVWTVMIVDAVRSKRVAGIATMGACCLPAPIVAVILLSQNMSAGEAVVGILGAWRWACDAKLRSLPYYRLIAGMHDVPGSLTKIAVGAMIYGLVAFAAWSLAIALRHRRETAILTSLACIVVLPIAAWKSESLVRWDEMVRPAPLVLLIAIFALSRSVLSRLRRNKAIPDVLVRLLVCIFSLALLLKMILNVHIYHYGAGLAMPATIVLVAMLCGWLPARVALAGGNVWVSRAIAVGIIISAVGVNLRAMDRAWSLKTSTLGAGLDLFYTDERGARMQQAVRRLGALSPKEQTLVVMPEGLMLNYLARRVNPSGFLNFTPPELIMYGEDRMLDALERNPPDWIALIDTGTAIYGTFGRDYGQSLRAWVRRHYQPSSTIGATPYTDGGFWIQLLERRVTGDGK